jgi:hypothetical protein
MARLRAAAGRVRRGSPLLDPRLLAVEQVRQASAEQQQPAEGDDVDVEHPGQVGLGEPEVDLHVRQGDPDDRRIHDHHELPFLRS